MCNKTGSMDTRIRTAGSGYSDLLLEEHGECMFKNLLDSFFIRLDLPAGIVAAIVCHMYKIPAHVKTAIGPIYPFLNIF